MQMKKFHHVYYSYILVFTRLPFHSVYNSIQLFPASPFSLILLFYIFIVLTFIFICMQRRSKFFFLFIALLSTGRSRTLKTTHKCEWIFKEKSIIKDVSSSFITFWIYTFVCQEYLWHCLSQENRMLRYTRKMKGMKIYDAILEWLFVTLIFNKKHLYVQYIITER